MTPIQPRHNGLVCEAPPPEELVCRADQPEQLFSSVDGYTDASSFLASTSSRSDRIHARYAQQVLERSRARILGDAGFSSGGASSSHSNPVASSLLGALSLFSATGCANHAPLNEDGGAGGDTGDPGDSENPPMIPGGEDGGLGSGINTAFGTGVCPRPLDLDPSTSSGNALMTCGHNGLNGSETGVGLIERLSTSAGGTATALQLPITLNNDSARPVFTTTSATGTGGMMYTGFAPRNTQPQLQGNSALFGNSGVFAWSESNPGAATPVLFDRMQINLAGDILPISLETHETVTSIRPNGPVSMVRVGSQLFVLSENRALNPSDARITNAPATIHRYNIAPNGSLSPAPVAGVQPGNVIFGTNTQTNAYLIDGAFHPTAIGDVGDGRIAAVIQGSDDGTNRSSIRVLTTDFGAAFNADPAHPDEPVSNTIDLIDSNTPGAPDFVVNSSSQVTITNIGGVPHALVGSADGSGRIAVVNLDRNYVENRVRFVNVLDDDNDFNTDHGDVANIVARPDGSFAYVITDTGEARAVTLTPGASQFAVGNVYRITQSAPANGTELPSLFIDSSILTARPSGYSKAPIN
ncbi:hypothetical protein FBR05_10615 [Deltaproteobacteria bacterium PRO3]|nr:hypothetical protein [Deltaproteobacteria bacterium PRO3]